MVLIAVYCSDLKGDVRQHQNKGHSNISGWNVFQYEWLSVFKKSVSSKEKVRENCLS